MRVLVVDDDPVCRLTLHAMVGSLGHEPLTAADGGQAWRLLQSEPVDVLVADREMPVIDGLELCRRVRTELNGRHVYVILATSFGSVEHAREGMRAGADDYLVKPTLLDDLELRLIAAERVTALHRQASETHDELRTLARRDPLTGLGNRRSLSEDLVVVGDQMRRYGHRCSVAMLDIDHFKAYNDAFGHLRGDEVLQSVARALLSLSRVGDTSYRYGGEEFLCLYPEQTVPGALAAVERLRESVARLALPHPAAVDGGILTLSAGIAEIDSELTDPYEAVGAADRAMYEAKRLGRNRVEVAKPLTRVYGMGR
ncbi:MAG TPA: diguanylate cyclase [Frankiaceae bacterium]|jgi:two-component system chemotaxis response regulator CheY|nr:diguanylate cyclase [Frankiaceae bacterium]